MNDVRVIGSAKIAALVSRMLAADGLTVGDDADATLYCINAFNPDIESVLNARSEYSGIFILLLQGSLSSVHFGNLVGAGITAVIALPASIAFIRAEIAAQRAAIEHADSTDAASLRTIDSRFLSEFTACVLRNMHHQARALTVIARRSEAPKKTALEKESPVLSVEEAALAAELNLALDRDEILVHYQPIVSLYKGRVSGFEALARWVHPERGILYPDSFIGIAERAGLVSRLTRTMFRNVCRDIAAWKHSGDIRDELRVSVNVSGREFTQPDLPDFVMETIALNGILPANIGIEITESVFMDDMQQANLTLLKLKNAGITLYMDDFGTGYSSLSYLQHFPVDIIKIDKSFVRWMHIDEQSEHIVKSIIGLAHGLQMKVVAEGGEEEEHVEMLSSWNCDYSQGYYHSKPLPFADATEFLREYRVR